MEKINFNLMQIIIDTPNNDDIDRFVTPSVETFELLPQKDSFSIDGNCFYEVTINNNEDYLWLSFDYGKAKPRDENITNIITGDKKDNERGVDEVELLNQIFCLFYYKNNTLYISNTKQKGIVEKFLKEKLNIDIVIKSFYKTPDEFIETIKFVGKIKFTYAKDLFNTDSNERQALIDLTGTEAPDKFTIEAEYNKHNIKNFLQNLLNSKRENKIKDLVVCGLDDKKFNVIYNADTFTRKIEVLCDKFEETGKFNNDTAMINLLKKLNNER